LPDRVRSVVVLRDLTHPRARRVGEALFEGAQRVGWRAAMADPSDHVGAELVLSYGWKHRPVFEACRAAGGHFLYVDLGYWQRRAFRGDFNGLHKVVLDARHATAYFQRRRKGDRLADAPAVRPWATGGRHILLAGLSDKGAQSWGCRPYEWELRTIAALRRVTDRPIVYRPKPSWAGAQPIAGAGFSPLQEPLEAALQGAHALVTPYSNAGIDALLAGVPVCSEEGLASVLATPLAEIEQPRRPDDFDGYGREQFRADVSYTQFSRNEIVTGAMFRQFLADGLIQ
jgi:hypothetical protein